MNKIDVFRAHLRDISARRRALYAFLAGLVSVLIFPPIGFFPALWISFPLLLVLAQNARTQKETFLLGWAFAFAQMMAGFYWMTIAMFVDLATFWWMIPFALAGLPAFLAVFYGTALLVIRRINLHGVAGCISFATVWFLTDYVRGTALSGLPWNLEGYGWYRMLPVMQFVSLTGTYGLTLLTLIGATLPALFVTAPKKTAVLFNAAGLALFILIGAWGAQHMTSVADLKYVPDVRMRLVQPNIDQKIKHAEAQRAATFDHLLELTSAPGDKPVTHVLWPETASPYYLAEDVPHRIKAVDALPPGGILLAGTVRVMWDENLHPHYFNSLLGIDKNAEIVAMYDKVHLVPFGEYIPLRQLLSGVRAVAAMGDGFSHGDHPETFSVPGLPSFSPMICYEGIFPGHVADRAHRPSLLVNITNDAWYGTSSGPYQHLAMVTTRAIEEGLPLVRSANTGISVMVDPFGRIVARKGLNDDGFLDVDIPVAEPPTPFVTYGNTPLWCAVGLLLALIAIFKYRAKHAL